MWHMQTFHCKPAQPLGLGLHRISPRTLAGFTTQRCLSIHLFANETNLVRANCIHKLGGCFGRASPSSAPRTSRRFCQPPPPCLAGLPPYVCGSDDQSQNPRPPGKDLGQNASGHPRHVLLGIVRRSISPSRHPSDGHDAQLSSCCELPRGPQADGPAAKHRGCPVRRCWGPKVREKVSI